MAQLWGQLRGRKGTAQGSFHALRPLSLQIKRGQSLGIVGLNGAGKSTLLQLAAGTLTPSTGQVVSRGRVAALLELGSGFNPEATGRENIYLYAATMGMGRAQVAERIDSIIEFSGLSDALDMPVKTYSSGMQVRLAFSVATVCTAGTRSEKRLAASIMPPARPSIGAIRRSEGRRSMRMGRAPRPVAAPASKLASRPLAAIGWAASHAAACSIPKARATTAMTRPTHK